MPQKTYSNTILKDRIRPVANKKAKKKSRRIQIRRRGKLYYVRIDRFGRWENWVNAGKSISIDKKRKAKTKAKPGQRRLISAIQNH